MKIFSKFTTLQDIIRERRQDVAEIENLQKNKLNGRIVTDIRSAPSSATDVTSTDAEGDIVTDGTYVYTLIDVSGTLKWDRRSHSTGW